ncbi:MAG: hypothetical protein AB2809_12830, partial [Candidatus Thiodiazotropha sp.]
QSNVDNFKKGTNKAHNPLVLGSSPSGPTNKTDSFSAAFSVEIHPFKSYFVTLVLQSVGCGCCCPASGLGYGAKHQIIDPPATRQE